jgi:hypothetical protein
MRVLCDDCAARPHRPPSATGLGDLRPVNSSRADSDTFRLLSVADLLDLPDPPWLIDRLIPHGLAVIYGAPAAFKSFLALDIALAVATGTPWHGRAVEAGYMVYVATEGAGGLKRRVVAWSAARGHPDLARARFLPESVDLLDARQVERARRTLATLPEPPALLVIDTMARTMVGGDENAARDVGRFIAAVDGQEVACRLVVHHAGKSGDERGSSALRGAADVMARVERDGQAPTVELVCDKPPKDGQGWPSLTLRAEPVAGSLAMALVPPLSAAIEAEDERRERIVAFVAEHRSCSRNRIERGVGGKASAVRSTLDALVAERVLIEQARGQSRTYSLPRPTLGYEVGTRYPVAPVDDPRPGGEHTPFRGCPSGTRSSEPSSPLTRTTTADDHCSTCGSLLVNVAGRPTCFGCPRRAEA